MMMIKIVKWYKSSKDDLKTFPKPAQRRIGFALYRAQQGEKHKDAKPLQGLNGVMEVVSRFDTNTYRAMYYTKILDKIVVLHCFQKKSKHGVATPKHEMDLIKQRLKEAQKEYAYH